MSGSLLGLTAIAILLLGMSRIRSMGWILNWITLLAGVATLLAVIGLAGLDSLAAIARGQ